MSVVKQEYQDLPPRGEKLADVVVLAQAWKKSHSFIRRHNWYADVLELDALAQPLSTSAASAVRAVAARMPRRLIEDMQLLLGMGP